MGNSSPAEPHPSDDELPLATGTKVGRYLVLERIGAGQSGVVYSAYDPVLHRKVALKLLRAGAGRETFPAPSEDQQQAQTLARLVHPNVVAIHDVGRFGDRVFLAMELSNGGSLHSWLAARPRGWRELVRVLRQAGEGLAAVHDAGLVHGDLKPGNILLDGAGSARIGDFGFAPKGLDAASDQLAFAALLSESLQSARDGAPSWLGRVVQRGMSPEPARRFGSMRELLQALDRGLAARPRRALLAAGALLTIAGAGAWAMRTPRALCTGGELAWGPAWDDEKEARASKAFAALSASGAVAESDWGTVDRALREARRQWLSSYKQICEATWSRGEQTEALLDARMRCLADRRNEVSALGDLFAVADRGVAKRAVQAALALTPPEACARSRGGSQRASTASNPALARLEALVVQANALRATGQWDASLKISEAGLAEARARHDPRLIAQFLLLQARQQHYRMDDHSSEASLNEAAALAEEAEDDSTAADVWTVETVIVGFHLGHTEEARNWSRYALAALNRAGEAGTEREAELWRTLGSVAWRRERKLEEALELYQRAGRLIDKANGDHADAQRNACDEGIAGVYFDMARGEDALRLHRKVSEMHVRLYGHESSSMSTPLVNVGEDLVMLGRVDEGLGQLSEALRFAKMGGPPENGYYHHRLALGYRKQGNFARALSEDDEAIELFKATHMTGDYWEAAALTGRGLDLVALGRPAEAIDPLERALKQQGDQALPYEVAETEFGLARALFATGARPRALALVKRAMQRLRPDAERYGSWFRALEDEMTGWLSVHRA